MAQKAKKSNAWPWGWSSCCFESTSSGFSCISFAILVTCALAFVFLLQSFMVARGICISASVRTLSSMVTPSVFPAHRPLLPRHPTELSRVVFAIAGAAKNWPNRKEYIRRWYNMEAETRAIVWLDQEVSEAWGTDVPPFKVSEDISGYPFNLHWRAATRIARIVSETFRLGLQEVDWFVMGDDDTLFIPANVVQVLSQYDPSRLYYIGSNSETHSQNLAFSFTMAFGGAGFAISFSLAKLLATMQDSCLARYPNLYGSDERIFVCMSELGVPLTKELGFHQMDIRGSAMGMLAAHPQTPLLSIHHMDLINPIFPGLTKYASIDHLLEAAKVEPTSVFQQSMCYAQGQRWSFSVSWGYVVQVYKGFLPPRELETPLRTFSTIKRGNDKAEFPFNTREPPKDPCKRPSMFYMKTVNMSSASTQGLLESLYLRNEDLKITRPSCDGELEPLNTVRQIRVLKKPVASSWFQAPQRPCCRVTTWSKDSIELQLCDCQPSETLITSSLY